MNRIALFAAAVVLPIAACSHQPMIDHKREAESQVRRLADELDRRTNDAGVYLRVKDDEIQERDPWGTRLRVCYAQGGLGETVEVRSAGADRRFNSHDDLVAEAMSANLKGVGQGIKDNAEETAAKAAKGLIKGGIEGLKESVKDSLKKKD